VGPEQVWTFRRKENFFALPEMEPMIAQPVGTSSTVKFNNRRLFKAHAFLICTGFQAKKNLHISLLNTPGAFRVILLHVLSYK
jgi:hypothetical protein